MIVTPPMPSHVDRLLAQWAEDRFVCGGEWLVHQMSWQAITRIGCREFCDHVDIDEHRLACADEPTHILLDAMDAIVGRALDRAVATFAPLSDLLSAGIARPT